MASTTLERSDTRWEWPSSRTMGAPDDAASGQRVTRLRENLAGGARYAGDRARTAVQATAGQVQQRPWTAVGAVLAIGIAIGWLAASLASERREAGAWARGMDGARDRLG